MAAKRRMMTLNAISLYDDLGDSESSSATKPSAKTDGEKSEPDAEASNRKRLRSEEGDKNSQGDEKDTIKSKAGNAADKQTENNSGVGTVSLLSVCGWRKGEREEMQDAHVLEDHYDIITGDIKACALYGIFDGHAGKRAAQFSSQRMPTILKDKLSACKNVAELENSLKRIFVDVYRQTDEQFLMMARKVRPTWKDGTTATTVLIFNTIVYCANIGDSRAVVCREKSDGSVVALQLTSDHSPLQFDERMRIQKAGGTVKDGRIMGILEVSRSIGDGQFKAHGVTCVPDVKKFSITAEDRFILIACDGLWKTFSNQEAVEYVLKKSKQSVKTENTNESEESLIDARYVQWERTAGEIAAESVRKGCGDNVSVIIVVLNDRNNSSRSLS